MRLLRTVSLLNSTLDCTDDARWPDIVEEYAFARTHNRLMAHDFDPSFKEAGEAGAKLGHFVKQMPWVLTVMKLLPDSVQISLNPVMASYIRLNQVQSPSTEMCYSLD